MDYIFITGFIGSFILVVGAAWSENEDVKHLIKSFKNWLFAIGGFIMLFYAYLSYQRGGSIFFCNFGNACGYSKYFNDA